MLSRTLPSRKGWVKMTSKVNRFLLLFLLAASAVTAKYKDVPDRPKCASSSSSAPTAELPPTASKLADLRKLMKSAALGAYVVPSVDQHNSEYIGESDKRRRWLSGFSGSAGVALVTEDKAILWTDGRYLLQAESELDCEWGILEMKPNVVHWAAKNLRGLKIGADPKLFTQSGWKSSADVLGADKDADLSLVPTPSLIDRIWKTPDRPARPNGPDIASQLMKFAGVSWEEKATGLRSEMSKVGADFLLVVDLMEIAWLFNLRGKADILYTPVFYGFAIVPKDEGSPIRLFVGESRITEETKKHLRPDCGQKFKHYVDESTEEGKKDKDTFCPSKAVVVEDYESFYDAVRKLVDGGGGGGDKKAETKFWFSSYANYEIFQTIPESRQIQTPSPPIREWKAVKNPTERDGMKSAHVKDAVALVKFVAELEKLVDQEAEDSEALWTEVDVAERLKAMRETEADSRGESFPTIAGFEANGAIIHYDPTKNSNPSVVKRGGMLLLDSGGQYLDGTTDVTRTFHYGTPTDYQKESYTRVLMGQVDLALAVFPEGVVKGNDLQNFARSPLWRRGMEYHHGTGHGIGAFLSVHEPPGLRGEVMEAGMFFSDEPGYYVPNQFGIRLENICFTKRVVLPHAEEGQNFLAIETITFVPYEPKLIDVDLLDNRQRKWLNDYHEKCEDVIGGELKKRGDDEARDWLVARTKKMPYLRGGVSAKAMTTRSTVVFAVFMAFYAILL